VKLRQKLQPIDYAVIIGGPLVCLLIIWLGIRGIVGPALRPNPVQLLRDNAVEIGDTIKEVEKKVGKPSRIQTQADGSYWLIYTRTVLEPSGSDSLDEATIELTPGGRVQSIRFDRSSPPVGATR
jgi:hypothetical protein